MTGRDGLVDRRVFRWTDKPRLAIFAEAPDRLRGGPEARAVLVGMLRESDPAASPRRPRGRFHRDRFLCPC
jgi:hypothetical protein